jgi:hypothetical protein
VESALPTANTDPHFLNRKGARTGGTKCLSGRTEKGSVLKDEIIRGPVYRPRPNTTPEEVKESNKLIN